MLQLHENFWKVPVIEFYTGDSGLREQLNDFEKEMDSLKASREVMQYFSYNFAQDSLTWFKSLAPVGVTCPLSLSIIGPTTKICRGLHTL